MQGMHTHSCTPTPMYILSIIKCINTVHTQKSNFRTDEFVLFLCSYDSL